MEQEYLELFFSSFQMARILASFTSFSPQILNNINRSAKLDVYITYLYIYIYILQEQGYIQDILVNSCVMFIY